MSKNTEVLIDGLTFTEGPRWHESKLYFSDFFTHRVLAVDLEGHLETIVETPHQPSGLGWLSAVSYTHLTLPTICSV